MKRLAFLYDNAMLYKDITQWMRNKTFLVLFMGLLAVSEAVAFIIATVPVESTRLGIIMFSILCFLLAVYAMAILASTGSLTSREFHDRTFELYEMSGMSLERMVFGKILSMLYQFAFGYFCIVPFMFFAYLLGGLDFSTIFTVTITVGLLIVPVYLMGLLMSLLAKFKRVGGLGRGLGITMLAMFVAPWIFQVFFFSFMFRGGRSPFRGLTTLFSFTSGGFLHLGIVLFFYFQICLLLFYLCCNAITRSTDSRETHVKGYLLCLLTTWMVTMTVLASKYLRPEFYYLLAAPSGVIILIAGLMFYYNRLDVPIVIRKRYEDAGIMRKRLYRIFQPGAAGGFRWLVYVYLVVVACALWIWLLNKTNPAFENGKKEFMHALSILLQIPYFIALPGGALLAYRKMRNKTTQVRTISILWWVLAGAVISIIYGFLGEYRMRPEVAGYRNLVEFVGIFVSPVPSFIAGISNQSDLEALAPMARFFTGILGLYLMNVFLRQRLAAEPGVAVSFNSALDPEESWKKDDESIPVEEKLRDTL